MDVDVPERKSGHDYEAGEQTGSSFVLLCFVCESVHAIMEILLSELDSCPDVEALSCEINTGA
jgi:hypothetical protein